MFKELFEKVNQDDVEYYFELANQAKKDKKTKTETIKILKNAGAPQDIIADLTQKMK